MSTLPTLTGLFSPPGPPHFPDGFELQDGVQIPGTPHGPLGCDESIQSQNSHLRPVEIHDFTQGQTVFVVSKALDFPQTIKLPPIHRQVEIFDSTTFHLVLGEWQLFGGHPVNRAKVLQSPKKSQKIFPVHSTGHIDVTGHQGPSVHEGAQTSRNDKLDPVISQPLGGSSEVFHES